MAVHGTYLYRKPNFFLKGMHKGDDGYLLVDKFHLFENGFFISKEDEIFKNLKDIPSFDSEGREAFYVSVSRISSKDKASSFEINLNMCGELLSEYTSDQDIPFNTLYSSKEYYFFKLNKNQIIVDRYSSKEDELEIQSEMLEKNNSITVVNDVIEELIPGDIKKLTISELITKRNYFASKEEYREAAKYRDEIKRRNE